MMPFELFVALRFLRESKVQTALILAAVSVGVAVVIFLSALIDGLQENLLATTLGSQAHITITRSTAQPVASKPAGAVAMNILEKVPQRERNIGDWTSLLRSIKGTSGVVAASPLAVGVALALRAGANRSVVLRGIDGETYERIVPIANRLAAGKVALGADQALIGTDLASDLGLTIGDKVSITTASGRGASFAITGIFDLRSKEINRRWFLTNLRAAQTLLDLQGGVTSIEIKVRDVFAAEAIALGIAQQTGLTADSWMQLNQQLMIGLSSQSRSRFVIEFFVIFAVALGIASVLSVSVLQKSREIGIMRAFGTPDGRVRRLFLIQGALLGAIGSVGGIGMGALLATVFARTAKNADGTPLFPIALTAQLALSAGVMALLVGVAAAAIPSWRATRLDPAEVIRYG